MLSEKRIQEFKDIYEKENKKEITWAEASECAHTLLNFAELMLESWMKEEDRKRLLKDSPKGYHLTDGTYTCRICQTNVTGDDSWYDKNGIKCMTCQNAVNKKVIPVSAVKNKDSWYSMWELDYYLGIRSITARKLIRENKLKPRIILNQDCKPYCYIFLLKENASLSSPKPKNRFNR